MVMIHRALRTVREVYRYQQGEMADKVGISRSHLSEIEAGKKPVSIELLGRYADVFNVPASTLLSFAEALEGSSKQRKENAEKLLSVLEWVMENGDDRKENARRKA